jgi:hypothetical protein
MVCGNHRISEQGNRVDLKSPRAKKISENPGVNQGREMAVPHAGTTVPHRQNRASPMTKNACRREFNPQCELVHSLTGQQ